MMFLYFVFFSQNFTSWLMDKMTMIGLESYQQNFAVEFPEDFSVPNEPITGTNVYGILRAPRTARTEAVVLLIPFKSGSSGPFYELVLLLSLAEHFRSKSSWFMYHLDFDLESSQEKVVDQLINYCLCVFRQCILGKRCNIFGSG